MKDGRPNRFYVAGPMRGYPLYNFPAFDDAAARLREVGYDVVNPAEIDRSLGFDETCDDDAKFAELGGIEAAMDRDFGAILRCDGIVLLPGWEHSTGARAELFITVTTGRVAFLYLLGDDGVLRLEHLRDPGIELVRVAPPQEEDAPLLVGLSGYARTGKDSLASFLIADHGFERIAFADALRDVLYALNPLVETLHTGSFDVRAVQTVVDKIGWEKAKGESAGYDFGTRAYLQRLGTEAGRDVLGENIWVDIALRKALPGKRYVITDCRFPNEADGIRQAGGLLVRLRRPGFTAINAHPSETALDEYRFDYLVPNYGPMQDLRLWAANVAVAAGLPDLTGTMTGPVSVQE